MEELQIFDPVIYSNAENHFLLQHLGVPPVVAMRAVPKDVNPKAVQPIIERVYALEELQRHEGVRWVGVDTLKAKIQTWLEQNAKWASDSKRFRSAPRWPSMFSFDGKGRAHIGGPESDSGRVRTYFGPAGERIPFAVPLVDVYNDGWVPPSASAASNGADLRYFVDEPGHRIECRVKAADGSICGHVETYKADSRASYRAARARMSKHLRKPGNEIEQHREVYTNEFGGNDAGN